MKVLLAIDFSEFSEAVIRAAERASWPPNTSFSLLHVVEPVIATYEWMPVSPYVEMETDSAKSFLNEAAQRISARGFEVTQKVLFGYPKALIIEYAEGWGADLVMVGSHGSTALTRFLMGSVARAVLRGSKCSVEVVRGPMANPSGSPMKILLAIDGSEFSEPAAAAVVGRTWPPGSEVRVVSVVDLPSAGASAWSADSVMKHLRVSSVETAQGWISRTAQMLSTAGLKVSMAVLDGNVKSTIVDEARRWGAGLIVVGSHGRHGLDRFMLGSVSEVVAMHSDCSVLVIKGLAVQQAAA